MWVLFAFGSAMLAGLTSVLAKCGQENGLDWWLPPTAI